MVLTIVLVQVFSAHRLNYCKSLLGIDPTKNLENPTAADTICPSNHIGRLAFFTNILIHLHCACVEALCENATHPPMPN